MINNIPLEALFENVASLIGQYRSNYPELYQKHKSALARKDSPDLEDKRANLAFKVMTKHDVEPSEVSKMIKARKKRARSKSPVVIKFRNPQSEPITTKMQRKF